MEIDPSLAREFENHLQAERRLQAIIPGAILAGGTAAALHAGHRVSLDGDHILVDLKDRFDPVLSKLEATPGWQTDRIQRPVQIVGSLDGYLTGVRQLRRDRPVEAQELRGLKVPTLDEMARIKAWPFLTRDSTRDFLDTVVLLDRVGTDCLKRAFSSFDEIYKRGPQGGSPLVELADRLARAQPADRASVEIRHYKGLIPPWNDWEHLIGRSRHWAGRLSLLALEE